MKQEEEIVDFNWIDHSTGKTIRTDKVVFLKELTDQADFNYTDSKGIIHSVKIIEKGKE